MKRILAALMVLLIAASGCGKKGESETKKKAPAKPVSQEAITDALYVEFLAHYKLADDRVRKEGQSQTGTMSPQQMQKAHLAKMKEETLKLEKQLGVTRTALELYMTRKRGEEKGYWMKNIYPKLEARKAELKKAAEK